jgi:hypothetical protein
MVRAFHVRAKRPVDARKCASKRFEQAHEGRAEKGGPE